MLSVEELKLSYGQIQALKGINLQVAQGEIVSIIGANGAGKTTLMKVLSGALPFRDGRIHYVGTDVSRHGTPYRVGNGLVLVPEGRQILARMTVHENLLMGAFVRRNVRTLKEETDTIYARFPHLLSRRNVAAGLLSGGEQQMLAIGRALMAKPKLLMLDEPSLGLAPLIVKQIFEIITHLRREGITILLVEQNARKALGISDRAYVLETGKVVMEGKASDLVKSSAVQEAYLGGSHAAAH